MICTYSNFSSLLFVEPILKKMNGISGRTTKSLLGVVAFDGPARGRVIAGTRRDFLSAV